MNKTLLFNHIPKTAGSSFLNVLSRQYADREIFHIDAMNAKSSIEMFSSLSSEEISSIKCITGHLSFLLEPIITNEVTKITFLRDPIDTFISQFFYIKRAPWNKNHKMVSKMKSITEFVDFCQTNNLINQQTRYMCGDIAHLLEGTLPNSKVTIDQLDKAIVNLNLHDFVLLTEFFDESLLILKNNLHWAKQPYYKIINKTKKRSSSETFTTQEIDKISDCVSLDIQLYAEAKKLFQDKIEKSNFNVAFQTRIFKVKNKLIYRFI
jgi:hypothetical protein